MKTERVNLTLLLVGLGFAILGQFYFAYRRVYVWDGLFFWCIALLAFGLLSWRTGWRRGTRPARRLLSPLREHPWRALLALFGAFLSLLVGLLARQWPETASFAPLLWLWLGGLICFLLPLVHLPICSLAHLRARKLEIAGLALLLLFALAVRAVDLEHIPANLGGDEGIQGAAALELLSPPLGNPFSTGWFAVPTMSFLWYGLGMKLFGASVAGLRSLSALVGTFTVLTTFLLAREMWGRRVGWVAGVLLACSHYHVHFSRLGSNQIGDGLFATLALWLLVRGLRSRKPLHFALSGAVIGLGWYGYFGARLLGGVVAFYLAWRTLVEYRFLRRQGRLLLLLLTAALVVAAPLLLHFAQYPDSMTSRLRQVNIFTSGWLARERESTGRSAASLLGEQFWKSISAFNYTLDPTFWYRPAIPLLDFVSGVLFLLGMVWVTAKWNWPAHGLLLIWFWLALLIGWVLTENPPSSMRLTGIAPALSIFAALGLDWLIGLARHALPPTPYSPPPTPYSPLPTPHPPLPPPLSPPHPPPSFAAYTPTRVYGNPTAEIATELARHLNRQGDDCLVYFYAPPRMYWDFGTLSFMARRVEGQDVFTGDVQQPEPSRCADFVFLPHRMDELDVIRARYPGGIETPVYSPADDRLLYTVYEWTNGE